jgi:hypothetical protein
MSWAKFLLMAGVVVGGAGFGFYMAGGSLPHPENQDLAFHGPADPSPCEVPLQQQRFPLSALDVKDTSEAPEVTVNCCGKVFLAWASRTGEAERTLFFTRSSDGTTFETPRVISKGGVYKTPGKGKMGGHERRAMPHLAAMGKEVHLTWSEALPDGSGMQMLLASSRNTGETFRDPEPVHSGEKAKATFGSFARGAGGTLGCVWLDDRAGVQQPFASIRTDEDTEFRPEIRVSAGQDGKGVCPCCPTAAAFSRDGTLYAAFRDINDGYRDITVSRLKPGATAFEGPFPVVEKTWKFDGCPHDGPSLAVTGDTIHVVWMDARTGVQRAYYGRAKLDDMKFETRELNAAGPGTQGNAKLFVDMSGHLHVVWEESLGAEPAADAHAGHQHAAPKAGGAGGRAVMYAAMREGKTAFGPVRAVAPKAGVFQTRPSVAADTNGNVYIAWNELDTTGKSLVLTRLSSTGPEACCK